MTRQPEWPWTRTSRGARKRCENAIVTIPRPILTKSKSFGEYWQGMSRNPRVFRIQFLAALDPRNRVVLIEKDLAAADIDGALWQASRARPGGACGLRVASLEDGDVAYRIASEVGVLIVRFGLERRAAMGLSFQAFRVSRSAA